jgi:hypothetical protein
MSVSASASASFRLRAMALATKSTKGHKDGELNRRPVHWVVSKNINIG